MFQCSRTQSAFYRLFFLKKQRTVRNTVTGFSVKVAPCWVRECSHEGSVISPIYGPVCAATTSMVMLTCGDLWKAYTTRLCSRTWFPMDPSHQYIFWVYSGSSWSLFHLKIVHEGLIALLMEHTQWCNVWKPQILLFHVNKNKSTDSQIIIWRPLKSDIC